MRRNKMEDLVKWKHKKDKQPLLLLGARQVGKTYLIKDFAKKEYENSIYINFEQEPQMKEIFERNLVPERIISELELITMRKINPDDTIIIFDEIQLEMKAITSLKYFAESDMNYSVIGAGSLLGVAIQRETLSFPVGKVEIHYLYPFTFDEFLMSLELDLYMDQISKCYHSNTPMPEVVHDKLMERYHHYLYVGGMPAAINGYLENNKDIVSFDRNIHTNIINAYIADMSKYTTKAEVLKVQGIYKTIPDQLAADYKKFKYSLVEKGAKQLTYGSSIEWLLLSQLSLECPRVNRGEIPLSVYKDSKSFKLFLSDVGLLMSMTKVPYIIMVREGEHNLFKGAITENYVAQQLVAKSIDIYYWKNNAHEVDFIIQKEDQVIPIEVKSSSNKRSRSLKAYIDQYSPTQSIRISSKNFGFSGGIKSVPLYGAYLIGE